MFSPNVLGELRLCGRFFINLEHNPLSLGHFGSKMNNHQVLRKTLSALNGTKYLTTLFVEHTIRLKIIMSISILFIGYSKQNLKFFSNFCRYIFLSMVTVPMGNI